jgi:hypothetical protein
MVIEYLSSLALLSFDCDLTSDDLKMRIVRRMFQKLLFIFYAKNIMTTHNLDHEEKTHLLKFFEFVRLLPPETQEMIGIKRSIPFINVEIKYSEMPSVPEKHQRMIDSMKQKLVEKDTKKLFIVMERFSGLEGGIYPIDLMIRNSNEIITFIRFQDEEKDYWKNIRKGEEKTLKRELKLMNELYKYRFPKVPIKTM